VAVNRIRAANLYVRDQLNPYPKPQVIKIFIANEAFENSGRLKNLGKNTKKYLLLYDRLT